MQSVFRMLNPVDRFYQIDVIHPKNSIDNVDILHLRLQA